MRYTARMMCSVIIMFRPTYTHHTTAVILLYMCWGYYTCILYLCHTHELKVPLAFTAIIMLITTFELPLFLPPTSSLSSLLATTARAFLPIAHASNHFGMDLSSLRNRQWNTFILVFWLYMYIVHTFFAFSWIRAPKTSRQDWRNCFVTTMLLNNLSSIDLWYFICNSMFASSSVHGVGRLNCGIAEGEMEHNSTQCSVYTGLDFY